MKVFMLHHLSKGADPEIGNPNNSRPISLTKFNYKVMEKMIKPEYQKEVNFIQPETQFGFRPLNQCSDAMNTVRHVFANALIDKSIIILVNTDYAKCFNTFSQEEMNALLCYTACDTRLISQVINLNSGLEYSVRLTKHKYLSKPFSLNTGVAQGSVNGPQSALVVLKETNKIPINFANEIEDLKSMGIFFADDSSGVFVFPKGTHFTRIQRIISEYLDKLIAKSAEVGLKLNKEKTVFVTNSSHIKKTKTFV